MKRQWQIGEILQVQITDLTKNGEGVAHEDGMTIFIDRAIPEDLVVIQISKVKQQYLKGKIVKFLQPSQFRREQDCPYFEICGGCQWRHIDYLFQMQMKRQMVINHLKHIGQIDHAKQLVQPVIGMKNPDYYRNKAQFKVSPAGIGYYKRKSHYVIPIQKCRTQSRVVGQKEIAVVDQWINESRVTLYDEKKHRGCLRGIVFRSNRRGELLLSIIVSNESELDKNELIHFFTKKIPNIVSLSININAQKGNKILGKTTKVIWGRAYIIEDMCDCYFQISAASFFQVNTDQAEKLYQCVIKLADINRTQNVFDLYCGTGTIGLCLSKYTKQVYGIECVPEAVDDARENATRNNVHNISFYLGKAEDVLPTLLEQGINADLVILDPPRKGCAQSLINCLIQCGISKIIYVSCDSATMARDICLFTQGGYQIETVQPVDLFPQTGHVETVCLMSRVKD